MLGLKKGLRVVRGPDWCLGNDDGGEGFTGTLCTLDPETKTVTVTWDNGNHSQCRAGHMGKYDLRIIDNAQIGTIHQGIHCDGCQFRNIQGIRFKCNHCFDYDLCNNCYHQDRHTLIHTFKRIQFPTDTGIVLPCRSVSRKIQLKGLFKGAKVIPGTDWNKIPLDNKAVHLGVFCDECNMNNIQGIRYKCLDCYNFDLCNSCYDDGKHNLNHSFLVKESPNSIGIKVQPRSFTEGNSFEEAVHLGVQCDECYIDNICGTRYKCNRCHNYDLCSICYTDGKHNLSHEFKMIEFPYTIGVDLPSRLASVKEGRCYSTLIDEIFEDAVHLGVQCDECYIDNICGIRYKCKRCHDYDLCSICYNEGKHDLSHAFKMIKLPYTTGVTLPPRFTSVRDERSDSTIVDGNQVEIGTILIITTWKGKTQWSAAYVEWSDGNKQLCRVGHRGYCDIQFIEAASGGQYYPEHLPILGKLNEESLRNELLNEFENRQVNIRSTKEKTQDFTENKNETFNIENISLNEVINENFGEATVNVEHVKNLEKRIAELEEKQMCEICLETRRDIIFLCGHGTCSNCATNLEICHMCRQTIKKKIRIY